MDDDAASGAGSGGAGEGVFVGIAGEEDVLPRCEGRGPLDWKTEAFGGGAVIVDEAGDAEATGAKNGEDAAGMGTCAPEEEIADAGTLEVACELSDAGGLGCVVDGWSCVAECEPGVEELLGWAAGGHDGAERLKCRGDRGGVSGV